VGAVWEVLRLLWNRRVIAVGLTYVAVAAALTQAAILLRPRLGLPDWVDEAALVILVLAAAPAVMLAWSSSKARSAPVPAPPLPAAVPSGRSGRAYIAVLPFTNLSREEADEIFADGMVEDLITGLTMNSTLEVVSRSSTFAYKGQSPDVRDVAADLGVGFVLEGSVRRTGERLRVTVQLIEAEGGSHVWAEKYDRPVTELFELQDDLVCEIAAALGDAVVRAELQRVRRNPASVSAWEESMRALVAQERPTLANIPEALRHARKAVEIDPNFALGHARLAMSLNTNAVLIGGPEALALRAEADDHIDKALILAPSNPKVLGVACGVLAYLGREDEAIRCGLRALDLNPHDAPIEGSLANAYFRAGLYAEAAPHYEQEERLSPRSPFLASRCAFHAMTRVMLGQIDKAEAVLNRGLEMDSAFEGAWVALTLVRMMKSDLAGAAQAVTSLRRLNPATTLELWLRVITENMPAPAAPSAVQGFQTAWNASTAPAV
jgi:adenylate cyclase